ncbi:CapA family protein [Pandoraea sp. NPDC090278]|uniref:CapA family protein n=1 Tax=Pandoraea sp. NPDC090278 TaxID=3364391 RepID=UPI00383AF3B4
MSSILRKWFDGISKNLHLEDGRWSSKCIHKEIVYFLKMKFPCQTTLDDDCLNHFSKASKYIEDYSHVDKNKTNEVNRKTIIMSFVGDLLFVPGPIGNYLSDPIFEFLKNSDCTAINLETPISIEHKIPNYCMETFNTSPEALHPWRKIGGAKIFSLCNNHALDCGIDGLNNTSRTIQAESEFYAIGGVSKGDDQLIIKNNDARIGFIGITHSVNKNKDDVHRVAIPIASLTKPECASDLELINQKYKKISMRHYYPCCSLGVRT